MDAITKKPTERDARWAADFLPMLYELSWSFESRNMPKAYAHMAEVCQELDRIIAHRDFISGRGKR